jgi:glycosyltransferase involved in cell wall biosynthesis
MSNPLVSVVVATYKRPQLVQRAVNSILAQTYDEWEFIVVNDDPETDVSGVIPEDPRISYAQHYKNRDLNGARNTGVRAASGKYIAFLDDDDEWKPTKLEKQVEAFEELDDTYGLIYAGTETVTEDGIISNDVSSVEGDILSTLLRSNVIPSPTPLVRRECFKTVGLFDETFRTKTDLEMWIRIAQEYLIAQVPEKLATTYQSHDDRMSDDFERLYQGQKRFVEKFRDLLEVHPDAFAYRLHELGMYASYTDRQHEAARYFLASLRAGRRDPLTAAYAVVNLLPSSISRIIFTLRRHILK